MPKVKYIGPHEAVEVDVPGVGVVERGQEFEVPTAELRDRLVKQEGNFESVKDTPESKPSTGRKE